MDRITPHLTAIQLAFGPLYDHVDQVDHSMFLTWVAAWDAGKLTAQRCPTCGHLALALLEQRREDLL